MTREHEKVERIRAHSPEIADLVHLMLGTGGWELVNERTAAPIRISLTRLLAELLDVDQAAYQRERADGHLQVIEQQQAARRLSELSDSEGAVDATVTFEQALAEAREANALAEATLAAARSGAPWPVAPPRI